MLYRITFYYLLVFVCAQPSSGNEGKDHEYTCIRLRRNSRTYGSANECATECVGHEYMCVNGQCLCADGYIPNYFETRCIPCPGLGEKCYGQCCRRRRGNGTSQSLQCWQGICQNCYDRLGNDICRDTLDQFLLVSTTQVILGAALVLGVIITLVLLYKLCAVTSLRPLGSRSNGDSRLSIGSLQLYVDERLRDAPPRYSRTPATASALSPVTAYSNLGFVHDYSIPPPPYTEIKNEETQNPALHI